MPRTTLVAVLPAIVIAFVFWTGCQIASIVYKPVCMGVKVTADWPLNPSVPPDPAVQAGLLRPQPLKMSTPLDASTIPPEMFIPFSST